MKRYNPDYHEQGGDESEGWMVSNPDGEYVNLREVVEWLKQQPESSGRAMAVNLVFDATADDSEDWALAKDNMNKGYGE